MTTQISSKEEVLFEKLSKKYQEMLDEVGQDIDEMHPQNAADEKTRHKVIVNGIECIPLCLFGCGASLGIGSVAAGAAGMAGGCVAICALTAEIGVVIAGAA